MKTLLTLLLITCSLLLNAQNTKRIKNTISKTEYETFHVLKNDKKTKQGEYSHYKGGRLIATGYYTENVKDSTWTTFNYNKSIASQGTYKNDLKEGIWTINNDFGKLRSKGTYSNGMKNGTWSYYTTYIKSGETLEAQGSFKDDNRIGIWEFYTKGDLYQTYNFETDSLSYAGPEGADTLTGIPSGIYKGIIFIDSYASFKNGDTEMYRFLANNMRYPQIARDKGVQGRVYISFVIDAKGKLSDIEILRGIGGGCDEEAIRVIKLSSGKWIPAQFESINVASKFNLPIVFKLQ